MNENLNTMKKDDLIELIKSKDNELNDVKSDIESLKQMVLTLTENTSNVKEKEQTITPQSVVKSSNEDIVKIGSCLIGRHFLCDINGSEVVELEDVGEISTISTRLLDGLMTSRNKTLFKEGLVYFMDDSLYERYSIKKNVILDEETVDKIFRSPVDEMIKSINKLTNEGRNEKVKYSLYWAYVKNNANGKEGYNDKNKEITLSNYFKVDINNSIAQLMYCKDIGYFQ